MPHFIEFARVSTTEYDEIVPMFKLRAFFRGESDDYFRFVQSPFYAMSATAKVRTRPVVFVNDINAGLEQLFESNRSTVSMEFGLEFHFSTDSLSRIRFANDAIRLFDFDAETTSVTSSLMQRFQQADNRLIINV
ncbi:unnamed protein product [Anisakis simplex]|uniref:Phage major capsid protein n=1 Tax=Anisakis simplex TaxID=6269 RepID=A0A0M3K5W3_ANISI|nr:unnamed protein product [Anisakis simplex]